MTRYRYEEQQIALIGDKPRAMLVARYSTLKEVQAARKSQSCRSLRSTLSIFARLDTGVIVGFGGQRAQDFAALMHSIRSFAEACR